MTCVKSLQRKKTACTLKKVAMSVVKGKKATDKVVLTFDKCMGRVNEDMNL